MKTTKIPFDYLVSITLTQSQALSTSLTLQSDSYFELETILGDSNATAEATDFAPNNFQVMITDTSTGRAWSNAQIPARLIAATARFNPMRKNNIILPPKTTLQLDFTNLVTNATIVAHLLFRGYKLIQEN